MNKQKKEIEYRYYEMPAGHYVLALLGDSWIRNYGAEYKGLQHFHNYLEVGYNYWGDGNLLVNEAVLPYEGNMVSLLPANIPHSTESNGDNMDKWEYLFIDIEGFILKEMQPLKWMQKQEVIKLLTKNWFFVSEAKNPALIGIVRGIIMEYREKRPHYKDVVKGYLNNLVVEMVRMSEMESNTNHVKNELPSYIEKSIQFISENYNKDLKIELIASAAGLSESHFRRMFEESLEIKPLDYLNMIRIDQACDLLVGGELSMEEIAYRVGFQNISTFNRNFKKITGTNPKQWKRDAKRGDVNKNFNVSVKKGW